MTTKTNVLFQFCRKATARHARWLPDCLVNWFIDREERSFG
jgi:hypothetical protein